MIIEYEEKFYEVVDEEGKVLSWTTEKDYAFDYAKKIGFSKEKLFVEEHTVKKYIDRGEITGRWEV